jgi:hypothetical protein
LAFQPDGEWSCAIKLEQQLLLSPLKNDPSNRMALSDACFEFLRAVAAAGQELAQAAHDYSDPDDPIPYGSEISALRLACRALAESPYDPEAGAQVLRLASAVMAYHDTAPGTAQAAIKRAEMAKLIHLLQAALDPDDAEAVPAVVRTSVSHSQYSIAAAERLKVMLSKLGKSAYEVAVKIIADICSAAVKKALGI